MNDLKLKRLMSLEKTIVGYYNRQTIVTLENLQDYLSHYGYPTDHFGFDSLKAFLSFYFKNYINFQDNQIILDESYFKQTMISRIIDHIEDMINVYLQNNKDVTFKELEAYLRDHEYCYGDLYNFIHVYYKDKYLIETKKIDGKKVKIISLQEKITQPIDFDKLIKFEKTIIDYYGHKEYLDIDALNIHLHNCGYDYFGFPSLQAFLKYYYKDRMIIHNHQLTFKQDYLSSYKSHSIADDILQYFVDLISTCLEHQQNSISDIEAYLFDHDYHYGDISQFINTYLNNHFIIENNIVSYHTSNDPFEIDPIYQNAIPLDLSIDDIEKGINIMRDLFYQLENKEIPVDRIAFNSFDKILIQTNHSQDLYKYNKDKTIIQDGMKRCTNKAVKEITYKRYFNILINSNTYNDGWQGILKRLEICHHELYDYFLALSLISLKKEEYFRNYLNLIKTNNQLEHLIPILKIVHYLFYQNKPMSSNYQTLVMLIYVDKQQLSILYEDICPLIDIDEDTLEYQLLKEIVENNQLSLELIKQLYQTNRNKILIHKIINDYWYMNQNNSDINIQMIDIFAYICMYYPVSYMEDIYNQKIERFTLSKPGLLIDMFQYIMMHLKQEYIPLVDYIIQKCPSLNKSDIEIFEQYKIDNALIIKKQLLEQYSTIQDLSMAQLKLFQHDDLSINIENDLYEQKVKQELASYDETSIISLVNELYNKEAYYLVGLIYHDYLINNHDEETVLLIIQAMNQTNQFDKAIELIYNQDFPYEQRDRLIIKTLAQNFQQYGLQDQAYKVFNEWSMSQAIDLLMPYCHSDVNVPYILMGIYATIDELYLNYLYLSYQQNSLNYSLMMKMIKVNYPSIRINMYGLIEKAFYTYDEIGIKTYFTWCKQVKTLKFGHIQQYHLLSNQFIKIMNNPYLDKTWQQLINKIDTIMSLKDTSLAYCVKAMYLLSFKNENNDSYYQNVLNHLHPFYDKNTNFMKLNIKLISIMNNSYYKMLLDVLSTYPKAVQNASLDDIQKFYDTLALKYQDSLDTTLLQMMHLVVYYCDDIQIHMDLYKEFIKSNLEKASLIQFLFEIYPLHKYYSFIKILLDDTWQVNDEEKKAIEILKMIYDEKQKSLFGLSEFLTIQFKNDVARIFVHYPAISPYIIKLHESNEYPLYYQLLIDKTILNAIYDHTLYKNITMSLTNAEKTKNTLEYQKNYMSAIETKEVTTIQQCYYNVSFGTFYIIRKYKDILLLKVLKQQDSFDICHQQTLSIIEKKRSL